MAILSIQSWVSSGHVGNAAACLPLQRLGFEVWPVNTVAFSNHPAHGGHTGRLCPAEEVAALIAGLAARGLFSRCTAVLSGYLGEAATGPVVLDAVRQVKTARPDALFCCDPVMGDHGRFFVTPGIPEFFQEEALAAADILLPNAFEAEVLTGLPATQPDEALAAADLLRELGPRIVVVTGIEGNSGEIELVAAAPEGAWRIATPRIEAPSFGAGDTFSALFLGHYLNSRDTALALSDAVAALHAVIRRTRDDGATDLALVAAQDALLAPPERFPVERLR